MFIETIKIKNFRNYQNLDLSFNKGLNIIYGNNAQGKTNLLESIYVLGLTKSHRSFIDNNLINNESSEAVISGKIFNNKIPSNLEITISDSKKLKIDSQKITKLSEYISKMPIIIFYPEDLELIKGSPSIRRRFLNLELSQLYSTYYNILNDYNKLLKMRNDYLKKIANKEKYDQNYLDILNEYFIDKSILIYRMRNKFINKLNESSPNIFKSITGLEKFNIKYKTSIEVNNKTNEEIKVEFKNKLEKLYNSEIKFRATLVGPHRDDIEFYINEDNIKNFGSQGQQRIAILSVKLSEIDIFKNYKNTTPILLLDDIFSELDNKKKNNLLKYIKNNIQTIITTTDLNSINKKIIAKSKLIQIDNGCIKKIKEVEKNGK